MEQQRESTNYRRLTYTAGADGVAIADESRHGENYSIVRENPLPRREFNGIESIDSQSGSTREKVKAYEDKPLMTTTKNFIGKSCYNVGCLVVMSESSSRRRKIRSKLRKKKGKTTKLRVSVLVGRKGFWLQTSGSGARL